MSIVDIDQINANEVVCLGIDTINQNKQALVFVSSKKAAEKQAEDIAKKIKTELDVHTKMAMDARQALTSPTQQCERLARCLKKGIAFHHSGLHNKQRTLIEDGFRKGDIRIICCTPTLAAGVDLPAFRSIIRDTKRYAGRFGMQYIPVLEYLQMAGRAGRPNYDNKGQSILIAKSEDEAEQMRDKYVFGDPESIYSKLAVEPVLRTYVLSLIATGVVRTKEQIVDFFAQTFWAHQYKDMRELTFKLEKMLHILTEWEFLKSPVDPKDDFVSGNEMFNETYTPTALGKRVAELYLDPLTAHEFVKGIRRAVKDEKTSEFAFIHLVSNTLEMRPLLRIGSKEWDLIQEESVKWQPHLIIDEPSIYDPDFEEYLESLKTAMMFNAWMNEADDEYLMSTYNIRPGETRVKLGIADWLLTTAAEIARILDHKDLLKHINKAKIRVRYGIKEELLALIKLKGIGRARARKLYQHNLKDLGDVRKAPLISLSQIIGPALAKKVKEQIENPVTPVPKGTRKGQLSVNKY